MPWAAMPSRCWRDIGRMPTPRIGGRNWCARSATRSPQRHSLCARIVGLSLANHTADVEVPGKLPALVIESVREFAKPEYARRPSETRKSAGGERFARPRRRRRGKGGRRGNSTPSARSARGAGHSLGAAVRRGRAQSSNGARICLCRWRRRLSGGPHHLAGCRAHALSSAGCVGGIGTRKASPSWIVSVN